MKDTFDIKGMLNIKKYIDDKLVEEYNFSNLVTNTGIDYFRRYIGGQYGPINKLGLGSSGVEALETDTSLKNTLILLDIKNRDYGILSNAIFMNAVIPQGSFNQTVSFQEGGLIFKNESNEILITRLVFPQIIYQTTDASLSLTYSLKFLGGSNG